METEIQPSPRPAPVGGAERLLVIDVLRGFAIFGILTVNITLFSAPHYVWWMDHVWWTSPADRAADWLIRIFGEGKFYTLFSFLFGLGMALQMRRVAGRGGRFALLYVRRLLVLLAIGLCHAVFFWYGDILTMYAVLGFGLLLFRKRSNLTILVVALLIYLLPICFYAGYAEQDERARQDPETALDYEHWASEWNEELLARAHAAVTEYGEGSLRSAFAQRMSDHAAIFMPTLRFMVPAVFAMFLLGFCVGRSDLLENAAAHRRLWWGLALVGLLLGGLLNGAYAAADHYESRLLITWDALGGYACHALGVPLLSAGYAATLILLLQHARWRRWLAPLAAVGRTALSNYLLQTLICTTLFYGYGFGLFGRLGLAWGLVLCVVMYALQVPLSVWWLLHFRFGPAEWLWRSLTYARWQPMRHGAVRLPPPTQGLIN